MLEKYIIVKNNKEVSKVALNSVDYFFKDEGRWRILVNGETCDVKADFDQFREYLGEEFYFCNRTRCLNLNRINKCGNCEIVFDNGNILTIGKNTCYETQKKFTDFIMNKIIEKR
ncbi:MAG: LytTR family transcriptional regulator DNA-binding domain-containing protein [Anaerovoracaceae bacterium]